MLGLSQAHSDALQNEWQSFLNLCICQEVHLDNIDNYRKVRHLLTLGKDVSYGSLSWLNVTLLLCVFLPTVPAGCRDLV